MLGILKAAGIIIGLLLCFLLCAALALLFVPVRYRVGAVKHDEKLQLNIGLSWMMRMVSAAISGGTDQSPAVSIRFFGFRPPSFRHREPKKQEDKRKNKQKNKQERKQKNRPEKERTAVRKESPPSERQRPENNRPALPELSRKDAAENGPAKTPEHPKEKQPDDSRASSERTGTKRVAERQPDASRASSGKTGQKRQDKKPKPSRTKKRAGTLFTLTEKAARGKKMLTDLWEKPSKFLRMAEEYEIKELADSLLGEALYLLSHYKPRRIRGYLRFGAGDPALTGYLTGLIYLFLPARADQFAVMPDFHKTVFETEVIFTGYIRSVHLIRVILHALRDKRLRRIFGGPGGTDAPV